MPKATPQITAFKAFDPNMQCRGFQYALGKTYKHKGEVSICNGGFHACEVPLDVLNYYPLIGSKFARVTLSGKIDRHQSEGQDSKVCGASIMIEAELKMPDFIKATVAWIVGAAGDKVTTGYRAHAASTGNYAHAASTGEGAHAASTGNYAHAASTGNYAHAASKGASSISASLGVNGSATAGEGGAIVLAHYNDRTYPPTLLKVAAFMVGQDGVEAGKAYRLSADGKPVECDAPTV